MNPASANHIERLEYPEDAYRQWGMLGAWNALLDIHNALLYGFTQYRIPEPGKSIDVTEAEDHIARIEKEWEAERQRRDRKHEWTGAPPFSKLPLNAKLYLHSVLREGGLSQSGTCPGDIRLQPPERAFFLRRVIQRWLEGDHSSSPRR